MFFVIEDLSYLSYNMLRASYIFRPSCTYHEVTFQTRDWIPRGYQKLVTRSFAQREEKEMFAPVQIRRERRSQELLKFIFTDKGCVPRLIWGACLGALPEGKDNWNKPGRDQILSALWRAPRAAVHQGESEATRAQRRATFTQRCYDSLTANRWRREKNRARGRILNGKRRNFIEYIP